MDIAADDLSIDATYKLLIGLIVPRPIAWVTTISPRGVVNLAPFSAFTYLSTKPPMVGISVTQRSGGLKDTARNIEATGEFVVNTADASLVEPLHASSAEHAYEVSEPELLKLGLTGSGSVRPPRLSAAPAAMECRLEQSMEFGEMGARLIVGRVLRFHVREGLLADGKIPTERLDPLGRIAGPRYTTLGEIIEAVPLHEGSRRSEGVPAKKSGSA